MKTQKSNLIVKASAGILGLLLLVNMACHSKNDTANAEQTNVPDKAEVKTPSMDIHTAAFMGNAAAINQHIQAGTNLDQKDAFGSTPLIIATVFGKTEIAIALINGGADLDLPGNDGSTPLHNAAFLCRPDIAKALLVAGADRQLKNSFGSTPLESITGSFEDAKPVYDQLSKDLGPLGLKLDYDYIKKTRPVIADMLK